jgi:hypothetical protein
MTLLYLLLCPRIQDDDTPVENWENKLKEMYKISLSDEYIVIYNTGTLCHTINSQNSTFSSDAVKILKTVLGQFTLPLSWEVFDQ